MMSVSSKKSFEDNSNTVHSQSICNQLRICLDIYFGQSLSKIDFSLNCNSVATVCLSQNSAFEFDEVPNCSKLNELTTHLPRLGYEVKNYFGQHFL
jgi:hypothetical protein